MRDEGEKYHPFGRYGDTSRNKQDKSSRVDSPVASDTTVSKRKQCLATWIPFPFPVSPGEYNIDLRLDLSIKTKTKKIK